MRAPVLLRRQSREKTAGKHAAARRLAPHRQTVGVRAPAYKAPVGRWYEEIDPFANGFLLCETASFPLWELL